MRLGTGVVLGIRRLIPNTTPVPNLMLPPSPRISYNPFFLRLMSVYDFYAIGAIGVLGALSPGPDFALVTKNSVTYSRRAGLLSSLGICLGILFHCLYCILGLALIISQSLLLFSIIRYIGASYIIYLGIKALFAKAPSHLKDSEQQHLVLSDLAAFKEGLLVNVLNPKCILFMVSIFTLVVKPHTPYWAQSIYAAELVGTAALWFCLLAYLLTHHRIAGGMRKVQRVVTKVMGVFLIGFGLDLFFFHR